MKIIYTGQQYGIFGSLLQQETRIAVDLLKDKFTVNHREMILKIEVFTQGKANFVRFKADTVVINIMDNDGKIIFEGKSEHDSI